MAGEEKTVFEVSAIDKASAVFRVIEGNVKSLSHSWEGLERTIAGAGAALAIREIVDATLEWERANNRIDAMMRIQQSSVGLTRRELDQYAESLSRSTEFSKRQILEAEGDLMKFGSLHGDVFKQATKVTADYAALTGQDIKSAANAIGRAVTDGVQGYRAVKRELGDLTFTQKEYINGLMANGRVQEAQAALLDIIQGKMGDTAEAMNTGLTKAVRDNAKAWEELFEKIGRGGSDFGAGVLGALTAGLHGLTNLKLPSTSLKDMVAPPAGGVDWAEGFAKQQAYLSSETAKAAAELDRQREAWAKAQPVLTQYARAVNQVSNEQIALDLVMKGEGRTFPDAAKVIILNTAVLMDFRREIQLQKPNIMERIQNFEKLNQVENEFKIENDKLLEQMQFETGLLGKTAYEQQQLTAVRELDLRTRERLHQAALAAGDDDEAFLAASERILDEQAKTQKQILDAIAARRTAERAWLTGVKDVFQEYIDRAGNAAASAKEFFGSAFSSMESAIRVTNGRITADFRTMTDQILSDLLRIFVVRQAVAAGASASLPFFGSLFGGGGAGADAYPGLVSHAGGVVDHSSGPTRMMPSSTWADAPRYHNGLMPDERAAILQVGETVLPRGVKVGGLTVHNHNYIGGDVTRADLARVEEATMRGTMRAIAEERRRNPNGPFGG